MMNGSSFDIHKISDSQKKEIEEKIKAGKTDNMLILGIRHDDRVVVINDSR